MTESRLQDQKRDRLLKSIDNTLIWIFWINLGAVATSLLLLIMLDEKAQMIMEALKK